MRKKIFVILLAMLAVFAIIPRSYVFHYNDQAVLQFSYPRWEPVHIASEGALMVSNGGARTIYELKQLMHGNWLLSSGGPEFTFLSFRLLYWQNEEKNIVFKHEFLEGGEFIKEVKKVKIGENNYIEVDRADYRNENPVRTYYNVRGDSLIKIENNVFKWPYMTDFILNSITYLGAYATENQAEEDKIYTAIMGTFTKAKKDACIQRILKTRAPVYFKDCG